MLAIKLGLVLASVTLCLGGKINNEIAHARQLRVFGGQYAELAEFPYLASLQAQTFHYCGCTILNNEWVLTAAHCIYGVTNLTAVFTVYSGTNTWKTGGDTHIVVEGEYHEGYIDDRYWPNDIAVLRVDPPFEFSNTTQAVVLAEAGSEVSNETPSFIAGWGYVQHGEDEEMVENLMKASVLSYDDAECLNQFGPGPTEFQICAGGNGKGVCNGDSGGPLLVDGAQVGITSWGPSRCATGPGFFTQVSYFRDWILEKTGT